MVLFLYHVCFHDLSFHSTTECLAVCAKRICLGAGKIQPFASHAMVDPADSLEKLLVSAKAANHLANPNEVIRWKGKQSLINSATSWTCWR